MSYNGSGTFLINTAGQPVVSGTVISSTAFNALTADLATGLSTAITKDGQTTITANIPMANYKFTGLGTGSAAGDSANLSQVQSTAVKLLASVSGADTITAVGSPNVAAYVAGQMFYFVAAGANTGAVTINIDSLGAKNITRDGTTALAAGDIQSGEVCVIVYDGTQFQLVNGASQSASIVTENLTVNKATVLNESGGDNDTRIEGDTDANLFFVDASTDRIGVGRNDPTSKLDVYAAANSDVITASNALGRNLIIGSASDGTNDDATAVFNKNSSVGRFLFKNSGGDRMLLDSSGNLGLGVTPAAWYTADNVTRAIQVSTTGALIGNASAMRVSQNLYFDASGAPTYLTTGTAAQYLQNAGQHIWSNAPSGTANTAATFTTTMALDASGNLGLGTSSPVSAAGTTALTIYNGTASALYLQNSTTGTTSSDGATLQMVGSDLTITNRESGIIEFKTANTARARITSGGDFLVGTTGTSWQTTAGFYAFYQSAVNVTRNAAECMNINRLTDDGTLVNFAQAGTTEGSISVSGNTVSYNAFAGSHWSQLQDGSKPDILRGTVMESINELCEWPNETNERLPKAKISDTAGSKKVYGVFMAWDNDWTETNDMYVTAVGAFICRVNGSVTVQEGDLLESNGDGTARVQADDIIRSSTIGKVTSTVKTHEYDDGSYCVPTVLYCG